MLPSPYLYPSFLLTLALPLSLSLSLSHKPARTMPPTNPPDNASPHPDGRTFTPSRASAALVEEAGGEKGLLALTTSFYEKAFLDVNVSKFVRDPSEPHAVRFSKWICEKLGAGTPWTEERRTRVHVHQNIGGMKHAVYDRSSAHFAAWHSPKRPKEEYGRHFNLGDCRAWMRLHFWAMREVGLWEKSPLFCDFYVRFIAHFVRVYEGSAPPFAREAARWSDPEHGGVESIARYIAGGRRMTDVLDISLDRALAQIPSSEAHDAEWPYINEAE